MNNKFLKTFIAALALATATGTAATVTSSQPVQAVSKHTWHWHWVKMTKNKTFYRVNASASRYRWRNIDKVHLLKRSVLRVRFMGNDNYFQVRASDFDRHGTWIVRGSDASWFRNYKL